MSEKLQVEAPFRVTDLKQWVYCPRILFYALCLPDVRPTTYKMEAGIDAGQDEEGREARRSLRAYGLTEGRREFNLRLVSDRYGLRGMADMVVWIERPGAEEVIPVDYKLSNVPGEHFKMQLMAYGLMLEELAGLPARRGFLYEIPKRRAEKVILDQRMRDKLLATLDAMHRMLRSETMPPPTPNRNKCLACEFRRFCNDVA
ncbi:MAG: CRISPR-associated protein Cas4 [Anaerolineales bacterium]